jgi:peptidoglycan hydrolase-like protein with peptidoglycan-binding domain
LTQLGFGYLLEQYGIDRKFGPATQNAVKTFQQVNGLDLVDDIVGPRSWDVLCKQVTLIQQQQPPIQQQQHQESAIKHIPQGRQSQFTIKMEFFSDTQDMEEVH